MAAAELGGCPDGPDTRPRVSANTASMRAFSCAAGRLRSGRLAEARRRGPREPTRIDREGFRVTDNHERSITFWSSRMFPATGRTPAAPGSAW